MEKITLGIKTVWDFSCFSAVRSASIKAIHSTIIDLICDSPSSFSFFTVDDEFDRKIRNIAVPFPHTINWLNVGSQSFQVNSFEHRILSYSFFPNWDDLVTMPTVFHVWAELLVEKSHHSKDSVQYLISANICARKYFSVPVCKYSVIINQPFTLLKQTQVQMWISVLYFLKYSLILEFQVCSEMLWLCKKKTK